MILCCTSVESFHCIVQSSHFSFPSGEQECRLVRHARLQCHYFGWISVVILFSSWNESLEIFMHLLHSWMNCYISQMSKLTYVCTVDQLTYLYTSANFVERNFWIGISMYVIRFLLHLLIGICMWNHCILLHCYLDVCIVLSYMNWVLKVHRIMSELMNWSVHIILRASKLPPKVFHFL